MWMKAFIVAAAMIAVGRAQTAEPIDYSDRPVIKSIGDDILIAAPADGGDIIFQRGADSMTLTAIEDGIASSILAARTDAASDLTELGNTFTANMATASGLIAASQSTALQTLVARETSRATADMATMRSELSVAQSTVTALANQVASSAASARSTMRAQINIETSALRVDVSVLRRTVDTQGTTISNQNTLLAAASTQAASAASGVGSLSASRNSAQTCASNGGLWTGSVCAPIIGRPFVFSRWSYDGCRDGECGSRRFTFTKKRSDTTLKIVWSDNFRCAGNGISCRWEVRINDRFCEEPQNSIKYDYYNAGANLNIHHGATVVGFCKRLSGTGGTIPAGTHTFKVFEYSSPQHGHGSPVIGWNWSNQARRGTPYTVEITEVYL